MDKVRVVLLLAMVGLLAASFVRLGEISVALTQLRQSQAIPDPSMGALQASNRLLSEEIVALRQQLAALAAKFDRK
jgi:cell division protein FtsB